MIVGTVVFAAVRPTTSPMCPASSDSSCLSAEPTRSISGAVASAGTMWSRSARTVRNGTVMSARCTGSPPTSSRSVTIPLSRTSICTVCRAAAPGKGHVVVRPAGHRLVGGDVLVVPEPLPQGRRTGSPPRSASGSGTPWTTTLRRHVAVGVEPRRRPPCPPTANTSAIGPMCRKSTGVASTRQAAQRRVGVVGGVEQRQVAAEAVAEQVDLLGAGELAAPARPPPGCSRRRSPRARWPRRARRARPSRAGRRRSPASSSCSTKLLPGVRSRM